MDQNTNDRIIKFRLLYWSWLCSSGALDWLRWAPFLRNEMKYLLCWSPSSVPLVQAFFPHNHKTKEFSFLTFQSGIKRPFCSAVLTRGSNSHGSNMLVMIMDYNDGKAGVDQLDENVEKVTCRRKAVRWPLNVLFNILGVGLTMPSFW